MGIAMLICMAIPFQSKAEIEDLEGYQGFVDAGYTFGTGSYGLNSIDITTTHGVQVIPTYLYVGVGAGLQYFTAPEKCAIPIFADVRSCFMGEENVSPFVDLKVGYAGIPGKREEFTTGGAYINPSVGCTFLVSDNIGLNLSIGYTFEQAKVWGSRENVGGFSLKLGVQF